MQLHFLPGQYLLNSNLIISNISNFSLVGNISDGEVHTVMNCTSPAGVLVEGSENILISNFVMWECRNHNTYKGIIDFRAALEFKRKTLLIINSISVRVSHFHSLFTSGTETEECRVQCTNIYVCKTHQF